MGVALFDLPMSAWDEKQQNELADAAMTGMREHNAVVENQVLAPVAGEEVKPAPAATEEMPQVAVTEELPQGAAAAELAAIAKPRRANAQNPASLPAPLVASVPTGALNPSPHSYISPSLPAPPPLGAPLVAAGVIMPKADDPEQNVEEKGWNMLNLKSLPIPGLGSVQAAHAAALDMPVPNTPAPKTPFTPAEQLQPAPLVLPGAPPLSDKLRESQTQPFEAGKVDNAPAPRIAPQPSVMDPNSKAQELARQQQDILMLRQQMDQRLKDLKTAEDKMQTMIKEAKQLEDQKVKSLVQMYANMKPRMAAQALENMDERVAVRILSGMAPKQSGEIMTYTNPVKTARFTEMITRMRMAQ